MTSNTLQLNLLMELRTIYMWHSSLTMLGHKSQEESKEERIVQKFGHGKCFGLKNCSLMRE